MYQPDSKRDAKNHEQPTLNNTEERKVKKEDLANMIDICNSLVTASNMSISWISKGLPEDILFVPISKAAVPYRAIQDEYETYLEHYKDMYNTVCAQLSNLEKINIKDPFLSRYYRHAIIRACLRALNQISSPPSTSDVQFQAEVLFHLMLLYSKEVVFYTKNLSQPDPDPLYPLLSKSYKALMLTTQKIVNDLHPLTHLLSKAQKDKFMPMVLDLNLIFKREFVMPLSTNKKIEDIFLELEAEFNACQALCAFEMSRHKFFAKEKSSGSFLTMAYGEAEKAELTSLAYIINKTSLLITKMEKQLRDIQVLSSNFLTQWVRLSHHSLTETRNFSINYEKSIRVVTNIMSPINRFLNDNHEDFLSPASTNTIQLNPSDSTKIKATLAEAFSETFLLLQNGLDGSDIIEAVTQEYAFKLSKVCPQYIDLLKIEYRKLIESVKMHLIKELREPNANPVLQTNVVIICCRMITFVAKLFSSPLVNLKDPKQYHFLAEMILEKIELMLYLREFIKSQIRKSSFPALWMGRITEQSILISTNFAKLDEIIHENTALPQSLAARYNVAFGKFQNSDSLLLDQPDPASERQLKKYYIQNSIIGIYLNSMMEIITNIYFANLTENESRVNSNMYLRLLRSMEQSINMTLSLLEVNIEKREKLRTEHRFPSLIMNELYCFRMQIHGLQRYCKVLKDRFNTQVLIKYDQKIHVKLAKFEKSLPKMRSLVELESMIKKCYSMLDNIANRLENSGAVKKIKQSILTNVLKYLMPPLVKYCKILCDNKTTEDNLKAALKIFQRLQGYVGTTYHKETENTHVKSAFQNKLKLHIEAIQDKMTALAAKSLSLTTRVESTKEDIESKENKEAEETPCIAKVQNQTGNNVSHTTKSKRKKQKVSKLKKDNIENSDAKSENEQVNTSAKSSTEQQDVNSNATSKAPEPVSHNPGPINNVPDSSASQVESGSALLTDEQDKGEAQQHYSLEHDQIQYQQFIQETQIGDDTQQCQQPEDEEQQNQALMHEGQLTVAPQHNQQYVDISWTAEQTPYYHNDQNYSNQIPQYANMHRHHFEPYNDLHHGFLFNPYTHQATQLWRPNPVVNFGAMMLYNAGQQPSTFQQEIPYQYLPMSVQAVPSPTFLPQMQLHQPRPYEAPLLMNPPSFYQAPVQPTISLPPAPEVPPMIFSQITGNPIPRDWYTPPYVKSSPNEIVSPEIAEKIALDALDSALKIKIDYQDPQKAAKVDFYLWIAKKDYFKDAVEYACQSNKDDLIDRAQDEFNRHIEYFIKHQIYTKGEVIYANQLQVDLKHILKYANNRRVSPLSVTVR